jgi:hypothetical protein
MQSRSEHVSATHFGIGLACLVRTSSLLRRGKFAIRSVPYERIGDGTHYMRRD